MTMDFEKNEKLENEKLELEQKQSTWFEKEWKEYLLHKNNSKTNPYDFWEENKNDLSILAQMARIYLSPPPGSAPSERIFSIAGNIHTIKRNRISPKNLSILTFLKKNYIKFNPINIDLIEQDAKAPGKQPKGNEKK